MINIENLLENETFVDKLSKIKTSAEVIELFEAYGIDINKDDAKEVINGLNSMTDKSDVQEKELSIDDLSTVAGGAHKSFAQTLLELLGKKQKKKYGAGGGGGRGF